MDGGAWRDRVHGDTEWDTAEQADICLPGRGSGFSDDKAVEAGCLKGQRAWKEPGPVEGKNEWVIRVHGHQVSPLKCLLEGAFVMPLQQKQLRRDTCTQN